MGKGRYSIVFNSPTGNTKKLADTIYAVLAKENCDYFGGPKEGGLYSEMLYIGFWTDKGNADKSTLTLLSTLKNKKILAQLQFLLMESKMGTAQQAPICLQ